MSFAKPDPNPLRLANKRLAAALVDRLVDTNRRLEADAPTPFDFDEQTFDAEVVRARADHADPDGVMRGGLGGVPGLGPLPEGRR